MAESSADRKIFICQSQGMHQRLRVRCAVLDATIQDCAALTLEDALDVEIENDSEARSIPAERER